ncbi:MAG: imidazole glycerol phosphate synthase subunit HisH [Candidatus Omnitrophica bacterium]|nr:imidazole glycerol phosphate synthase subunit HisH [Candidatus Omnitrophota bacterium]
MIAIIDYGMGNIHSVKKALESQGAKTRIVSKPGEFRSADKVVLPGVGAFSDAMRQLRRSGIGQALDEHIKKGGVLLGICLGMQMLFEKSREAGDVKGLAVLKGRVEKFIDMNGLKVPHIGWNKLDIIDKGCPLFKGLGSREYAYFCHSYYAKAGDEDDVASFTEYGINFASAVYRENVYGVQFHPEKSQNTGLKILNNFIKLC